MGPENVTQADWDAVAQERAGAAPAAPEPEAKTEQLPPEAPAQDEAQQAAPEPEAKVEDPYANLHPEVQAKLKKFDELSAAVPALVNELRETKGRVSAIQSNWDKARQQINAAEQPSQKQIAAATKDPEKWEDLKATYPEWGEAIGSFVESRLAGLPKTESVSQEQIEQLVAQRTEAATAELRAQMNEAMVAFKHPTWRDEVKTPAFQAWFAAQTPDVQQLAASPHGPDAIRMLDLFTESKAKPVVKVQEDRQQKLAAAATSPRKQSAAVVVKSFDDMTPQEQWQHMAAEREKRAGR